MGELDLKVFTEPKNSEFLRDTKLLLVTSTLGKGLFIEKCKFHAPEKILIILRSAKNIQTLSRSSVQISQVSLHKTNQSLIT